MTIYDPGEFTSFCYKLGGKVTKLKVKTEDGETSIETAVCVFEGKKLELIPIGYEHDEAAFVVDGKDVDLGMNGYNLNMEIKGKHLHDVKRVWISANHGGEVEFEKRKRFKINHELHIKVVE